MSYLTICLIFIIKFSTVLSSGMLGPANLIYKSAEQCPDAPRVVTIDLTARKVDRTNFGLNLHLASPYDFDDQLGIVLVGSQMLDGGYKEGAFHWNSTNMCESLQTLLGEVFEDFLKNRSDSEGCPLPKGAYELEDYVFDNEKFNVPKVYGDYRMEARSTREGVDLSCLLIYYELVPKDNIG